MGRTPIVKWQLCSNRVWCLLLLLSLTSCLDEKSILLSFRSSISDPNSLLSSWDTVKSPNHCVWYGVLCDQKNRVVSLNITGSRGFRRVSFVERKAVGGKGSLVGALPRVVAGISELRVLILPFHAFEGELPSEIWAMKNLQVIDLEGNLLSGSVPVSFPGLRGLRVLNLAYNEFSGGIPGSLALCSGLEVLNLAGNKLNGSVPWLVNRVKSVNLSLNRLGGKLPEEIGEKCDALESLDVSGNLIVGGIPKNLGNCRGLVNLILGGNLFEETIPSEIGRLEKLEVLDLSRNSLSGRIPSEIGNCSSLSVLVLSSSFDPFHRDELNPDSNIFHGGIPLEIFSSPMLKMLWAPAATLEGQIPDDWGSCEMLEVVNLANNIFSGSLPSGIRNCKNLFYLDFSSNSLSGAISPEIRVSCLSFFDVSNNNLSGDLSMSRAACPPLPSRNSADVSSAYVAFFSSKALASELDFVHNFGGNNFTGVLQSMPISPSRLKQEGSYTFTAAGNRLNGTLPGILYENCSGLKKLSVNMSGNLLFGEIPRDLGSVCKSLIVLDLSRNRISGSIPESLRFMDFLVSLNLSGNLLEGSVPSGLGFMKRMRYLSLAGNNLNGSIPSLLGKLEALRVLDLSSNSFTGEIPEDVVKLKNLTSLLLNDNKLSGEIPGSIAKDKKLVYFNVSFNNLSGPLPWNEDVFQCSSTIGNPFLSPCRAVSLMVPSSDSPSAITPPKSGSAGFNPIEIASIASASAILSVLILLTIFFFYSRKWSPRSRIMGSTRKEVTIFSDIGVPISFDNVVRATGAFNATNCIGHGGFGATYKAEISPGVVVAIKRLAVGRFQGVQQFRAEIKTLARLRHPNLVTLIGYHASETEMFLIYNYLPRGNLEKFIQERRTRAMDWRVLHKIALDIARALAYLHDDCVPRVLHRDVKPSNILLDEELNAYLSDFGLARLLGTSETHATTGVAGTFGYVAPEYAMTCRVSDKADVYSYGVVLLELLSDKKALDPSFSSFGNGFNIVAWAWMLLKQGRAKEFFTLGLWDCGPHDDLVEVLRLALVCTVDSLSTRPTMKQVVRRLKQLQPPPC